MFGEGEFGRNEMMPRCDGAHLDLFHSELPPPPPPLQLKEEQSGGGGGPGFLVDC
jgi:hypothetical protein